MPSFISNFLWKHVFTAFLPPINPDDVDYYAVLGLPSSPPPTTDDVRKAYRKLSLELHPDKIAQRGGGPEEQDAARIKYEAVQQAYGVLVDPKTRSQYNDWQPSSTRYQFVNNSQWMHPAPLFENLSQASIVDKSKLILLVTIFLLALLVQPILVCVKVNQDGHLEDASWLVLLIPLWCFGVLVLLFWTVLAVVTKSAVVILVDLEYAAWLVGCVVLACIWDDVITNVNWYTAAIPFYLGILLRILQSLAAIRTAHEEQDKMISPDHHHKLMHDYRDLLHRREMAADEERGEAITKKEELELLEDFPTEEAYIDYLQEEYIVVTVNEEVVATTIAMMELPDETGRITLITDDEKEVMQVTMSHEFMSMEHAIYEQRLAVFAIVTIGVTFVTLVAHKLQSSSDRSWWAIFAPFWIYFALKLFNACFMCCCTSVSSAPIIVRPASDANAPKEAESNEDAGDDMKPRGSVSYADADGSIDEFNRSVTQQGDANLVGSTSPQPAVDGGGASTVPDSPETVAAASTDNGLTTETDIEGSVAPATGQAEGIQAAASTNGPSVADAPAGEPEIDFEAAYHAWQNAHAQAEQSAMEQQTKATGTCCTSILQLIIVCCIVGKLQAASEGEYGYSALWVLFPIFLFTGIILCCCSFFIYSAGPDTMNVISERTRRNDEQAAGGEGNAQPAGDSEPVIIPYVPTKEPDQNNVEDQGASVEDSNGAAVAAPSPATSADSPVPAKSHEHATMDDLD